MVRRSRSNQSWAQLTTHRPNPLFLARPTQAFISTREGRLIIVWGLAAQDVTARTPSCSRCQLGPNHQPFFLFARLTSAYCRWDPRVGLQVRPTVSHHMHCRWDRFIGYLLSMSWTHHIQTKFHHNHRTHLSDVILITRPRPYLTGRAPGSSSTTALGRSSTNH